MKFWIGSDPDAAATCHCCCVNKCLLLHSHSSLQHIAPLPLEANAAYRLCLGPETDADLVDSQTEIKAALGQLGKRSTIEHRQWRLLHCFTCSQAFCLILSSPFSTLLYPIHDVVLFFSCTVTLSLSTTSIALCLTAARLASLGVAAPVSVAPPPPPPMVQLTPQIPLTGFVARMQESSKYSTHT